MALFTDYSNKTLEDVMAQQAESAAANLKDQYTQAKRQNVAAQAHGGRLMSGVADYPLSDLETQYTKGLSGIESGLAGSLASVPEEDWLNNQEFQRQLALAKRIGDMNRPSTLDEVFQGIGTAGGIGATFAAFA